MELFKANDIYIVRRCELEFKWGPGEGFYSLGCFLVRPELEKCGMRNINWATAVHNSTVNTNTQ